MSMMECCMCHKLADACAPLPLGLGGLIGQIVTNVSLYSANRYVKIPQDNRLRTAISSCPLPFTSLDNTESALYHICLRLF